MYIVNEMYQMVFKNSSCGLIICRSALSLSSLQTDHSCPLARPQSRSSCMARCIQGDLTISSGASVCSCIVSVTWKPWSITAGQHPTERILKRVRQWSNAYKTMFLLVCCSLLILNKGDTFFNGLWSKSTPSQEALARYPDPPRAMEMDSSATRAPQASASPMAGSTCCTHSRWVCLEASRSQENLQTQSCFNSRICCIWYAPQVIYNDLHATSHYIYSLAFTFQIASPGDLCSSDTGRLDPKRI